MKNKKLFKNKKADIGITILVMGVIALCVLALMSFISAKQEQNEGIVSVVFLEKMYGDVESFKFSGAEFIDKYEGIEKVFKNKVNEDGKTIQENDGFVIERDFDKESGLVWKTKKKVMKVKYKFDLDNGG